MASIITSALNGCAVLGNTPPAVAQGDICLHADSICATRQDSAHEVSPTYRWNMFRRISLSAPRCIRSPEPSYCIPPANFRSHGANPLLDFDMAPRRAPRPPILARLWSPLPPWHEYVLFLRPTLFLTRRSGRSLHHAEWRHILWVDYFTDAAFLPSNHRTSVAICGTSAPFIPVPRNLVRKKTKRIGTTSRKPSDLLGVPCG